MLQELTIRQESILAAIVEVYTEHGEAVSSSIVSKRLLAPTSSATVRNVAKGLVEQGFLIREHTSSGSLPSVEGIRYYVERLLPKRRLSNLIKRDISALFGDNFSDTTTLFREMGDLLSFLAKQLGVVVVTRPLNLKLHRIDAIPLSANTANIMLIFNNSSVRTFVYRSNIDNKRLSSLINVLNERLAGLSLQEITLTIEDRLRDLRGLRDDFVERLISDKCELFDSQQDKNRVIVGNREQNDVLDLTTLGRPLLNKTLHTDDAIHLDSDENSRIFLVSCKFSSLEGPGIVGFLGNKRLPYFRVVPLIRYAAQSISKFYNNIDS